MFKLLMFCLSPLLIAQPLALRAGAAQVDINPRNLPVVINCGFLERSAAEVKGNLFARSVVFDDGKTRIAMTVVDSCMMPRELIDRAKQMASAKTGIPMDRMMISATHTHSAPAAMACLGSREHRDYAEWLPERVAEAIAEAASKLEPARIGATSIDAPEHTFCRRWIYRPEKMLKDPFGEVSVRANMIPGYQNPDVISPSGPVDSELSIVSIQAAGSGKPIAVIANYGNHYFGASGVSPDYFGLFDKGLAEKIGGGIVMMSQGTSGDANTANYAKGKPSWTIEEYAGGLIDLALSAYKKIQYEAGVPVLMAESTLPLGRRLASAKRLEWAAETVRNQKGEKPANQPEVYAHEQLFIRDTPRRELKLQAIRIGNIGFTAIPNEVYALTGLKLKAQSPMPRTINIELANGAEGYIPPPEQHLFGGYTTWAARTAGLETTAEPKIVEDLLLLLENVADRRRNPVRLPAHAAGVLREKPIAYWPLDDMVHGSAADASGAGNAARHNGRVALFLPGAPGQAGNRAAYFAGGSVDATLKAPTAKYTVEFRFWPGVEQQTANLVALNGGAALVSAAGAEAKAWHHAAIVSNGKFVTWYVDGKRAGQASASGPLQSLRLGDGFEGKIDEVVVLGRTLGTGEIARRYLPNKDSK